MKRLFLLAIFCGVWCGSAQARPIRTWDMDALVFGSDAVVEGRIESTQTEKYDVSARFQVEKSLAGDDLGGQKIELPYLGLYRKQPDESEPHLEGIRTDGSVDRFRISGDEKAGALSVGDPLICFLQHAPASAQSSATSWSLITVKLIRGKEISGFAQWGNLGGLGELRGESRASFDAELSASRKRIGDFKARLTSSTSTSAAYWLNWVRARNSARLRWFGTDALRRAALGALIEGQNWAELAQVFELPTDSDHSLLVSAFDRPSGQNFLLNRLADASEARSRRLQWARVLQENVGSQSRAFGGTHQNGVTLLSRVGHLALQNRGDEGLSLELVRIATQFAKRANGFGWNKPQDWRLDLEPSLRDLQLLRARTRFAGVKAQIDATLELTRPARLM